MYVVQNLPPEDNTTASAAPASVEALIANLSKFKIPCEVLSPTVIVTAEVDTASPFQLHLIDINF